MTNKPHKSCQRCREQIDDTNPLAIHCKKCQKIFADQAARVNKGKGHRSKAQQLGRSVGDSGRRRGKRSFESG